MKYDTPRLGPTGRRWLACKLAIMLDQLELRVPAADLVAFLIEHRERFTTWVPVEEWAGPGFVAGRWTIDRNRLAELVLEAEENIAQRIDAERFSTLDDWLRADIAGELVSQGSVGGIDNVPVQLRPKRKVCRCGATFTPKRRKAVSCPACIAKAKAKRAMD